MVVEQKQPAQEVASSAQAQAETQAQAALQSSKGLQNGTQKDLQVEVLRIIAMLMIVACHMIIHLNIRAHSFNMELLPAPGLRSALKFLVVQYGQVGVSIFFIISGYFLCRKTFRYRRVFAAWAQMFFYCIIVLAVTFVADCFGLLPENLSNLLHGKELVYTLLWNVTPFTYRSYWFMSAYLIMLMFMPFINILISHMTQRDHAMLLVLLASISLIPLYFGKNYTWNDIIYAIFGYLAGAFIAQYGSGIKKLTTKRLCACVAISTVLMLAFDYVASSGNKFVRVLTWDQQVHGGIGILPMIIAMCIFILVHRINMARIQGLARTVILRVSKATFGVYLLHEHMFIFVALWTFVAWMLPATSSSALIVLLYAITLICTYAVLSVVAVVIDLAIKPLSNRIALTLEHVANCVCSVYKTDSQSKME